MLSIWSGLLLLLSLQLATGLKFDLIAHPSHNKAERCIRNFVNKDVLVVVTTILDGSRGDGQVVNMHVRGVSRPDHSASSFYLPSALSPVD